MLPDPDTVCTLSALDYQERPRDAAQQRLAESAEMGARSRATRSWPAGLAPASWLMGWVARVYGAQRVRESLPPAPNPPRPVHHGA